MLQLSVTVVAPHLLATCSGRTAWFQVLVTALDQLQQKQKLFGFAHKLLKLNTDTGLNKQDLASCRLIGQHRCFSKPTEQNAPTVHLNATLHFYNSSTTIAGISAIPESDTTTPRRQWAKTGLVCWFVWRKVYRKASGWIFMKRGRRV